MNSLRNRPANEFPTLLEARNNKVIVVAPDGDPNSWGSEDPNSLLSTDQVFDDSEIANLIECYEAPLPLHTFTVDELVCLSVGMTAMLTAWKRVSASAQITEPPGFMMLLSTEYGCVQDAIQGLRS